MGRSVFAVARSIWDDPDFAREPYTQREAWMWLVSEAAWKERPSRGNTGSRINLGRAELSFATRFLAVKWGWSKSKVDRFIQRIEERGMLRDVSRDGSKIYLVTNYNHFQVVGLPKRDSARDGTRDEGGTTAGQQRDKEETGKQDNRESHLSDPASPDADACGPVDVVKAQDARLSKSGRVAYSEPFQAFWRDYPTDPLMSKAKAFEVWKRLSADDRLAAHGAVPAFKDHCRKNPTYRPVHAERFLSQRRFEGFAQANAQPLDHAALRDVWGGRASPLVDAIGPADFGAYFTGSTFRLGPPTIISVPGKFAANRINEKFGAALRDCFGEECHAEPIAA